ncbi:hypothetical protein OZ410_13945 [Robiginitalea sp. M366]|uniref:ligand-binding sensor domain-containing protein n=1 Tax=Robiginitalea aestuariiviva TaxID=3036903 RepID=UPI00240E4C05|nr:two-component regulator propeller domain-containing protein [Robiginitalea aestuariiviva]MDG1573427.1 hypothetical protein [Robiginitalea aestuariiviva]
MPLQLPTTSPGVFIFWRWLGIIKLTRIEVYMRSAIRVVFPMVILGVIMMSCRHFEKNTASGSTQPHIENDSSFWLKETRGIRDILQDRKGNLWFSSPDYVAMFDGKTLVYFTEKDGLGSPGNLHEDADGKIWVENGTQVFVYHGQGFSEIRLDSIAGPNGLWMQRGLSPTDTTYAAPGLYEVRSGNAVFHPYPVKEHTDNKYLYFPSTKAAIGKDSTVWMGTMERVFGFKDQSFVSIGRKEMGRHEDKRQMGIRGIFVDSEGKLWIADNGAGVFVYNGKETLNFTRKHNLDEGSNAGSTLHRAFSVSEDAAGTMWFGTVYSGIWSYHPKTGIFKNYTADNGVKSDNIWTIYKTREGQLLFAGESPGAVYIWNGNTFIRKF